MYASTVPERKLMAAVLIQAMKDAIGVGEPPPTVVREAQNWLKEGSADWICNLIGISPSAVRNTELNDIRPFILGRQLR